MIWIYYTALLICTASIGLGTIAVVWLLRFRREVAFPDAQRPPISVLKPLKGMDESLEENLETFANQTYPNYELLLGVEGESDPAVAIAQRFIARHPKLPCRLIIHDGGLGLHPKIANIRAILEKDTHDLLIIADSNVAVPPEYIERIAAHMLQPGVGLVTNLYVGTQEQNLPTLLENMNINGPILNLVAFYRLIMRETLVLGKSTSLSKSDFAQLGGFQSLSYVLAEDYLMGKMVKRGGYRMDFSTQSVNNVNRKASFKDTCQRYLRWSITRSHVAPFLYPFELLVSPIFLALLAPLVGISWGWSFLWMISVVTLRDLIQWPLVRGFRRLPLVLLLNPFRELLYFAIWLCAPFMQSVQWRGNRLHIGEGTHLFIKEPPQ